MDEQWAIPKGYMTVGEAAKKLNTTVFTLQYYDNKDIYKPSCKSEGGRRLYTHKDIAKLHQILSLKYLGFSLKDIKTRIRNTDTPEEVATLLSEQALSIRAKISSLTDVLEATETLKEEVLQIKSVDWEMYADILVLLQAKHDLYWARKYLDDTLIDRANSLDKANQENIIMAQKQLFKKVNEIQKQGVLPESEKGQSIAKQYWDIIMDFTNGDEKLLAELFKLGEAHITKKKNSTLDFLEKALNCYTAKH